MESWDCCLQSYELYCVPIPLLNAEMKPVLPLPVETEHLVVMTLQFLYDNLSVELLVPTYGNTVRDCFAAKSIKMSIAVYSLRFIISLYYFYCNNTQRHLQGLGAMVSHTLQKHMGKRDVLLRDVLQSVCRQVATGEWEVSPSSSYVWFS